MAKILHVCAIGGTVETLLRPQIDDFLSRGLTVEIACSPGPDVSRLEEQGYVVHPIFIDRKISPLSNIRTVGQLAALMQRQQYDLVHVHTAIAAVLGRIAAKLAGVKRIVYTAHGFPFHDRSSPHQYKLYFMMEKLAGLITDLILTQNHEDVKTARTKKLCSPEKVQYLGNGIDIRRFNRDRLDETHEKALRQSLGIPDHASLIIGTIGRLTRKKGSEYLVEATAKLIPSFPGLHTVIIGDEHPGESEPIKAKLLERIQDLGIQQHITFTGSRTDIVEILGLLDVFTLPTFTHEGLPRSILEAMAMELPVVTTDIRGCREAVIHGKTGFIVPSQNVEELASALATLLEDPTLRKDYGKNGRQRIETTYDERLVFQRLENFYRELDIEFTDQPRSA